MKNDAPEIAVRKSLKRAFDALQTKKSQASGCPEEGTTKRALDVQVGGGHYKDMPIQPVEFCQRNRLGFCESSAIKYLCRHGSKNGLEDLKKARHFIDLLIQLEHGEKSEWD